MTILLQESLRAIFYAPFYAAIELQAYEKEGVEVRFISSPHPSDVALKVLDGSVDVLWGGPMRVMWTYDRIPDCDLVCFCEVITRDPFFVIGREPLPEFQLTDLMGKRFGRLSEVATPWMCLQEDFRRAGIDPDGLQLEPDRTMKENVDAMRRGELDAIQTFQPFVEELLDEGVGHIWYEAADRGPTSYTTLYTRRSTLQTRRDELRAMVRAIYRTQKWIHAATISDIAAAIEPYFPDVSHAHLMSALERYKKLGVWGRNPLLPRGGYERLRAGLLSGGLVRNAASYETAVDNSLAQEAINDNPPPI